MSNPALNVYNNAEQNRCTVMPHKFYGIVSPQGLGITDNFAQYASFIREEPRVNGMTFPDIMSAYRWCSLGIMQNRQILGKFTYADIPNMNFFLEGKFVRVPDMILPAIWGVDNAKPRYFAFFDGSSFGINTTVDSIAGTMEKAKLGATFNEFFSRETAQNYLSGRANILIGAISAYLSVPIRFPQNFTLVMDRIYRLPINLLPEGQQIWNENLTQATPFTGRVLKEVIKFIPPNGDAFLPKK